MESYKITVLENELKTTSSREYMIRMMREALKYLHKSPNDEIGVMFEETDSCPKYFYFITSNNAFLSRIKSKCRLELSPYPPYSNKEKKYLFLGNKDFFPPKV